MSGTESAGAAEGSVTGEASRESVAQIQAALHSVGRSLKRGLLHEFLRTQAQVAADQAGLAVLYVLHRAQTSLRLTDLSEKLGIDAPAVTRKVQQLERSGLVSRAHDDRDARVAQVQLTPAGRQTIGRFLAARQAWLTGLLGNWTEEERATFALLLSRFADDLHRHLEELDG